MINLLSKIARWWVILLLLGLFLLANFYIIPAVYPKFQTLDSLTKYTPDMAYQLIESYGEAGRHSYALIEYTLDLIYPFVTALLFSLVILVCSRAGFPDHHGWLNLALIPFGVMLADYLENICVISMLLLFPVELRWLAGIASVFTLVKFILTPLELIFIIGLVSWLIRLLRNVKLSHAGN